MRKGRAAVILQRPEQRIGINLIAGAVKKSASIIAAHVIPERVNRGGVIEDVFTRSARVQNGIAEHDPAKPPPAAVL